MSRTKNYNLYVTDDDSEWVQNMRREIYGETDSNMTKIDEALSGKANLDEKISAVLSASAWSQAAPHTQDITDSRLTAKSDGLIVIDPAITGSQLDVVSAAKLHVSGQTDGSLTVTAHGVKPDCDIPIIIIVFG